MPDNWFVIPLDEPETLSQMLRRLIDEKEQALGRDLTQREIAESLELEPEQQNVISKYLSGAIKLPSEDIIKKLAHYFGIEPEPLMLAAFRSSRRQPRRLPKNSYAVPGDPVLLSLLAVVKKLPVEQVVALTSEAQRHITRPPDRNEKPEQGELG